MRIIHSFIIIVFSALLLSNAPSDVVKAKDIQKKNIKNLEWEISRYHREIQKNYKHIKNSGLIKNNKTRIPLLAQEIKYPSRRQNHVYNSEMYIHWDQSGNLKFLEFKERIAISKTFELSHRVWLGQLIADSHDKKAKINGYMLDFISYEKFEYGTSEPQLFRVHTGLDTNNNPKFPDMPNVPIKSKVFTTYTKDPKKRIKILLEYLKLLQLADRRVSFFTRKARVGSEEKLDYMLP